MADCGASSRLPSFSTTCRFRTTAAQGHLPERCGRHRPDGPFFTLKALSALLPDYGMDFVCEVAANFRFRRVNSYRRQSAATVELGERMWPSNPRGSRVERGAA